MKTLSTALAAHLQQEVTTLATCWKLTRKDSVVLGFTDHDRDITFEGVTYLAKTGFTPSAIQSSGDLRVDNLDMEGMLSADALTEADIRAGRYDFAEIGVFMVNYRDLSQGSLALHQGWLGEVAMGKTAFLAEIRGLSQRLSQTAGEFYSASCRAALGDARCKVNLAAHTVTGAVSGVFSALRFSDAGRGEASGIFSFGKVSFSSGANSGLSMEVKEYLYQTGVGGVFTLVLPLPYALQPGDTYAVSKGCDKTTGTCAGRFGNIVNFRGEPLVPGLDRMLETAGTRSEW
ncbi:MAG: DUF2163 domain-containing protein [Rickettsiales bacterium]|nr:DUF2163 domain-containing protein [Rickettsiales bacterium]